MSGDSVPLLSRIFQPPSCWIAMRLLTQLVTMVSRVPGAGQVHSTFSAALIPPRVLSSSQTMDCPLYQPVSGR